MKIGLIIHSNDAETVWNAFRYGNFGSLQGGFGLFKPVELEFHATRGAKRLDLRKASGNHALLFPRNAVCAKLAKAKVTGEIVRHGKGDKIVVFKMKRRKNYARKQGHRQGFTEVKINDITLG